VRVADRDAHLRGPDFLDAERYPQITLRSTRVENAPTKEGDRFSVVGDLVIRDTPMDVVLDCRYEGRGTDPWGKTHAGFSFRTEIDRRDWGLKWTRRSRPAECWSGTWFTSRERCSSPSRSDGGKWRLSRR
jgi:polyisoprenoid-binding protein YceI